MTPKSFPSPHISDSRLETTPAPLIDLDEGREGDEEPPLSAHKQDDSDEDVDQDDADDVEGDKEEGGEEYEGTQGDLTVGEGLDRNLVGEAGPGAIPPWSDAHPRTSAIVPREHRAHAKTDKRFQTIPTVFVQPELTKDMNMSISNPARPRIMTQGIFWSSSQRNSMQDHDPGSGWTRAGSGRKRRLREYDPNLGLPPLTKPKKQDPVVCTLGIHSSLTNTNSNTISNMNPTSTSTSGSGSGSGSGHGSGSGATSIEGNTFTFTFTRSDIIAYRQGKRQKNEHGNNLDVIESTSTRRDDESDINDNNAIDENESRDDERREFGGYDSDRESGNENDKAKRKDRQEGREREREKEPRIDWNTWKGMTISQGCWRKWEDLGGLPKGLGELLAYGYDQNGKSYKPDMTHVQAIRLVIAASPKRMMTLAQIYQAIEERWPWHKTAGSTWKNSIRHNLSLNDCFVNTERPMHEGGNGKGGYWVVDDNLSGKTARKLKRSGPSSSADAPLPHSQPHSRSSSYPYPSPTKSNFGELFTTDRLPITGSTSGVAGRTPPSAGVGAGVGVVLMTPPPQLPFLGQSGVRGSGILNPSGAEAGGSKGKGKIAKPAAAYPYAIPQRLSNWVPDEVIQTSREIGMARPVHDTPLDQPLSSSTMGAASTTSASSASSFNDGLASRNMAQDVTPLSRAFVDSTQALGTSSSGNAHPQPYARSTTYPWANPSTSRGGIPPLPLVEPKSSFRRASGGEDSLVGVERGRENRPQEPLPPLMNVLYQPLGSAVGMGTDARMGEAEGIKLPPVEGRWSE